MCTPLLILVLSASPRLWAGEVGVREAPVEGPAPEPLPAGSLPEVEALLALPLFQTRIWEEVAQPPGNHPLVSLSVNPDFPARWLVADETGAVYYSDDAGARWMLTLPGVEVEVLSGESLLLEAELVSADALDDLDEVDAADGVDGADPDAESAAIQEANEQVSELVGNAASASPTLTPTVWFDPAGSGVALAGRNGEVWRSADGGETWLRVDADRGATAFARVGTALVAGGEDGVRASLDEGLSWIDVVSALKGRRVQELTRIGDVLHAATDDGLFLSSNALTWSRVTGAPDGPLVSVVPDPDLVGGYWIAAERGLFRTDDGGETFSRFANQPLRGLRRMVHLPEAGHLFAISADGVWESADGGIKWTPASRLLSDPDVRALDFSAGEPIIATARGVWHMVQPEKLTDFQPVVRPVMPMAMTVRAALGRSGMTGDLLALARKTVVLPFVPTLSVQFNYDRNASRDADFGTFTSSEARDISVGMYAQLCWGGCSTSSAYYDYDTGDYDVQQMVDDGQLAVIGGEVYGANSVVAAAANVAQSLATYRVSAAEQISEAWMTRARLVADGNTFDVPLRDRVMQTLAVQEIDARLDAWTNGQFTTWKPESP